MESGNIFSAMMNQPQAPAQSGGNIFSGMMNQAAAPTPSMPPTPAPIPTSAPVPSPTATPQAKPAVQQNPLDALSKATQAINPFAQKPAAEPEPPAPQENPFDQVGKTLSQLNPFASHPSQIEQPSQQADPTPTPTPQQDQWGKLDDVHSALAEQQNPSQDYRGMCQMFVEDMTLGHHNVYPSAAQAWNSQLDKAKPGTAGIAPGDVLYFKSDDPHSDAYYYGHTGIYVGNNQFVSATDGGIATYDLNQWHDLTGQEILGYLPYSHQ